MEFRFANPSAFQLLWLLPVIVVLGVYLGRRQGKKIWSQLGERLAPFLTASLSSTKRQLKLILQVLALGLFVFALARPQSGESRQKVKSEGVEIMLMVDVSQSMLAEDVRPSRMELAKKELIRLLDMAAGDRIGLIAFAGSAIMLSPLTPDKSALKMYVESLGPKAVTTQGTEFRKALLEARNAFYRGGVEDDDQSVVTRVILIASDGEDNEPGAMDAAAKLADEGIRIFSLAFGTEKGGPIPLRNQRGELSGYKKSKEGQVILTQTKGTVLKDLASRGKGSFHHATFGGNAMRLIYDDIRKLEKTQFESAEITNYDENYQIFLLAGLILAMAELLLGERRARGRIWRGRFEVSES